MSRFFFQASGLALGGRIDDPVRAVLETQAATSLPSIGGYARASAGGYIHDGIVWFSGAESVVTGIEEKDVRYTVATAAVDGLNVRGRVTADRVVAGLTSTHRDLDEEVDACPTGSYFTNLRIDGKEVALEPVDPATLCKVANLHEACGGKLTVPDFVREKGKKGELRQTEVSFDSFAPRRGRYFDDQLLLTYLYKNPIHRVDGLGVVYLGELLISRFARRLTMVRVHLGSPVSGMLVAASVQGNGHDF